MTVRFNSLQHSVAFVGATLFTALLVFASTPLVPIA